MQSALLLIALGFGYKIFAEASSNGKKRVKQLGQLVGSVIMIVSFLGTLCAVSNAVQYGKAYCPTGKNWLGSGKMCPFTGAPLNTPDQAKK